MKHKVVQDLEECIRIFEERNAVYGDTFEKFGEIAGKFFDKAPKIETPEDWNRLFLVVHMLDKLTRYVNNFDKGGHPDSLMDLVNYTLMLKYIDEKGK